MTKQSQLQQSYLFDASSLTRRLSNESKKQVRISVVEERWYNKVLEGLVDYELEIVPRLLLLGNSVINNNNNNSYWLRQVFLYPDCNDDNDGNEFPFVYARTVFPYSSIEAFANVFDLTKLGTKSLGEVLFNKMNLIRRCEICVLPVSVHMRETIVKLLKESAKFCKYEEMIKQLEQSKTIDNNNSDDDDDGNDKLYLRYSIFYLKAKEDDVDEHQIFVSEYFLRFP